jgi:hypothetical protein
MKLRLRHDFLRLRLTQGEVARLCETGRVEEWIDFSPDQRLTYLIETAEASEMRAQFRAGAVSIIVPAQVVKLWADSQEVGIEAQQDALRITVEKDFACTHPASEDENRDTFPNPAHGQRGS